jgi:hypothetical protein
MAGKGRLVIEPFRTTVRTDPQFAGNTWKTLENAICEIFNGDASHLSFESLYRASYNMVLHKHAELLYENLGGTVQGYLDKQAAAVAGERDAGQPIYRPVAWAVRTARGMRSWRHRGRSPLVQAVAVGGRPDRGWCRMC